MSLADALLISTLSICFELVLDKKTRDNQLQSLARYTNLLLKMAPCARVFGAIVFCKEVSQPNFAFDFKAAAAAKQAKEQAAKEPASGAAAGGKKGDGQAKGQPGEKQQ